MTPLQLSMQFTLKEEGKFTIDTGGPTMYGVTQAVYDAYRHSKDLPLQTVAAISDAEVADIMASEYWNPTRCDQMPVRLAVCAFDWSYNHGVHGAIQTLQICLGVTADGQFGAQTLAAMNNTLALETPNAPHGLVFRFLDARREWYHNAVIKDEVKYEPYLDGWLNRVDALEAYVKTL